MTFTNMQVLNLGIVLQELILQPMYVKAAIAFRRLKRNVIEESKIIEEERLAIANRLCKKDENDELIIKDNQYLFESDENKEEFHSAIEELFAEEVNIEFEPINVNSLGDIKITIDAIDFLMELGLIKE